MRKVYVEIKVKVIMNIEEGINVSNVINELDYNFSFPSEEADIVDTEIMDFQVTDSK